MGFKATATLFVRSLSDELIAYDNNSDADSDLDLQTIGFDFMPIYPHESL